MIASADPDHDDDKSLVVDAVHDPKGTNPDAVERIRATEFPDAGRTWVGAKPIDLDVDSLLSVTRESFELPRGSRGESELITDHGSRETDTTPHVFIRDEADSSSLAKRSLGGGSVVTIFPIFGELTERDPDRVPSPTEVAEPQRGPDLCRGEVQEGRGFINVHASARSDLALGLPARDGGAHHRGRVMPPRADAASSTKRDSRCSWHRCHASTLTGRQSLPQRGYMTPTGAIGTLPRGHERGSGDSSKEGRYTVAACRATVPSAKRRTVTSRRPTRSISRASPSEVTKRSTDCGR